MEQSMFATELKNVKRQNTLNKKKIFFRNKGLLFDGKEKVLDAFRDGIFLFKTKYIHAGYLERILTPETPITAPIIEDIP